jgi:hypothetical protein
MNISVASNWVQFFSALVSAFSIWLIMPWSIALWICFLPSAMAVSMHGTQECAFPDIAFKAFNDFVTTNFSSKVSLATVLLILFSLQNSELLSLHGHQQKQMFQEHATKNTAWIKALAKGVRSCLSGYSRRIFKKNDRPESDDDFKSPHLQLC